MNVGKKIVGNYLLIEKIGEGQFGVVFKALHLKQNRKVYAIKSIPKNKLEKHKMLAQLFETEVAVMSKMNHPNVMHLFEFMESENNFYLVIQYCNNGDLEGYMKNIGRLSEQGSILYFIF